MPSEPVPISVVVTVRNEESHLRALLDSLIVQEPPFEILIVDGGSRDGTLRVAREFERAHPGVVRAWLYPSSRGEGRNHGVARARHDRIAFTDGDCVADPGWLAAIRRGFLEAPVVAGTTVPIAPSRFGELERVELYLEGSDVTFPSANLGYAAALFRELGGFDPRFVTAEDIDLNLRAVQAGARILHVPEAIIRHRPRESWPAFLRQAFWNGYGRKQLTEKHGAMWGHYRVERLAHGQRGAVAMVRLGAALTGYFARVLTGRRDRIAYEGPVRPGATGAPPKAG
ncbi:MAG: glycosyltransferase [Thermoplasmata archaeon]